MVLNFGGSVFQSFYDLLCIVKKADSGRGEADSPCGPVQQFGIQFLFQSMNLAGDCGLGNIERSAALAKFRFSATWTNVFSCCVFMVPFLSIIAFIALMIPFFHFSFKEICDLINRRQSEADKKHRYWKN